MLISEPYRAANAHLHATTDFGVTAPRFADMIRQAVKRYDAATVLDYGSGTRRHVEEMVPDEWGTVRSYDPCVPHLAAEPAPADLLVSCDVLEHIEPECLAAVLDHMQGLARKALFLTIATRPAKKLLPDGRNAHLIIEGAEWWLPRLMARWRLRGFTDLGGEIVCMMETRP